ncbi:hypothetical protein [Haladaptatus sp. NG-SE-30]
MPETDDEIELPRFARQIIFIRGRYPDTHSDATSFTTGILAPFGGVLNRFPTHGHWISSNLSYLVLQSLVVTKPTENARDVHHANRYTPTSHRTDAAQIRTVLVPSPSIFRPVTRIIEERALEERTSVERADELQTRRLPTTRGRELAESIGDVDRGRPP